MSVCQALLLTCLLYLAFAVMRQLPSAAGDILAAQGGVVGGALGVAGEEEGRAEELSTSHTMTWSAYIDTTTDLGELVEKTKTSPYNNNQYKDNNNDTSTRQQQYAQQLQTARHQYEQERAELLEERVALNRPVNKMILEQRIRTPAPVVKRGGFIPPLITVNPISELYYRSREIVTLGCEASGDPSPVFLWERNGVALTIDGSKIRYAVTSSSTTSGLVSGGVGLANGTITISFPDGLDGVFQCFASNKYGKALSTKTTLRKAGLDSFPSRDIVRLTAAIGSSLKLNCTPPRSYPRATIFWGIITTNQRNVSVVETDDRISLDYNGNLYFANVNGSDGGTGIKYVCVASNDLLRTIVQGDDKMIMLRPLTSSAAGVAVYNPPKLLWSSSSQVTALNGSSVRMKCIFGGNPTPRVKWTRDGTLQMNSRIYSPGDSYGQELVIDRVEVDDKGQYVCSATNDVTTQPSLVPSQTFLLRVESGPTWRENEPPQNVDTSPGESAQFDCLVNGTPEPRIQWLINGVPIDEMPVNRRRTLRTNYVNYVNITATDGQVLQCNASNVHGWIFANAYLSVREEPPSFSVFPPAVTTVLQGHTVRLPCTALGAPKPLLVWLKGDDPSGSIEISGGERFVVHRSGHLEFQNAASEDEDIYYCQITNKFGSETISSHLLVLGRTSVTISDEDQTESVMANNDVTKHCDVTLDSRADNVTMMWLKDGEIINNNERQPTGSWYEMRTSDSRTLGFISMDYQLMIRSAAVKDTGTYTCRVTTQLDSAESKIRIVVRDRPSAPMGIELTSCSGNATRVTWLESDSNNDPVLDYSVYYTTSYDPTTANHTEFKTDASVRSVLVGLKPWRNYTFYVTARNSVGMSDRSNVTAMGACSTPPALPTSHPNGVCSQLRGPTQLVIIWKPIDWRMLNGAHFHYIISYQRRDLLHAVEELRRVSRWNQSELVIGRQEPFREFIIYVKSANEKGEAAVPVIRRIVRSGEAAPLVRPTNFRLNISSLNQTNAEFMWDAINNDPNTILGYFRGYQVRFWRTGHPADYRTVDVILHQDVDLCPLASSSFSSSFPQKTERRGRALEEGQDEGVIRALVDTLWPHSAISAGVAVLNRAKIGELSNIIEFDTGVQAEPRIGALQNEVGDAGLQAIVPCALAFIIIITILAYLIMKCRHRPIVYKVKEEKKSPLQYDVLSPLITPPSIPLNVTAYKFIPSPDDISVTLRWDRPDSDGGVPITGYVIMKRDVTRSTWSYAGRADGCGKENSSACDVTVKQGAWEAVRHWTGRGMIHGSDWLFRVAAENDLGRSDWSTSDRVKFVREPPGPPLNVRVYDVTKWSCCLSWSPPQFNGGTPVTGYHVEKLHGTWWVRATSSALKQTTHLITGLIEGSVDNEFRVLAENVTGTSIPSASSGSFMAKDPITVPASPRPPTVADITHDSALISWCKPDFDGGSPVTGYILEMRWRKLMEEEDNEKRESKEEDEEENEEDEVCNRWKTLTGYGPEGVIADTQFRVVEMEQQRKYEFRVTAVNEAGWSEASLKSITIKLVPPPPPPVVSDPPPSPSPSSSPSHSSSTIAPRFTRSLEPTTITLKRGDSGVLQVPFVGRPQPLTTWRFNGEQLAYAARFTVETIIDMTSLVMTEVEDEDAGRYSVTLENDVGTSEVVINVVIVA